MKNLKNETNLKERFYTKNVCEVSSRLKNVIEKTNCSNLKVDISDLNFIDASKVAIDASIKHFIKYNSGRLTWVVKDDLTKFQLLSLALKNVEVVVKEMQKEQRSNAKVLQFCIR